MRYQRSLTGRFLALAAFAAALGSASEAAAQDAPTAGELRMAPCTMEGVAPPAWCGTFTVWEDREAKSGRTLDLNVVLLEATGIMTRPHAYVLLTGGPGQGATGAARGLSDSDIRRGQDILLVDQRGTGDSNGLFCGPDPRGPLQAYMATIDPELVAKCRRDLERRADLRHYLTPHAMDDLDDLREAMGYDKFDLRGASYGTRAALVYLRRHGERVRSVTLMGATAMGHPMPAGFATDAETSIRNVIRDCAAEASCAAAFPDLEAEYHAVRDHVRTNGPIAVDLEDPRTDEPVTVQMTAAAFAEALRAMLYSPGPTRQIPLLLHRAATEGEYRPFVQFQLQRNYGLYNGLAQGMYFALSCTEDVPRVDPEAVYASGAGTFLADHRARAHIEGCRGWPLGELPPGYGEEVESDVPVLLVTGANDPATPPASARLAASRLTNARIVIVPGGGHSLGGLEGGECVSEIVARFLETADPAALDTSCVANVRRPPFTVPRGR